MKKITACLIFALLCCMSFALSANALGETMNVKRGTIVVDGKIDDKWADADRQPITHLTNGDKKADGLPADWYAYASMLWDDDWVYFLFECKDDDWVMDNNVAGHWSNDCIYLYVDENCLCDSTWKDGQYQFALIPADGMSLLPRNGSAVSDGNIKSAYSFNGDLCVIEVAFKPQYIKPADGTSMLVDFQRHDDVAGGTRDYCVSWSDDADKDSSTSAAWGKATFVGAAEEAAAANGNTAAGTPAAEETAAQAAAPEESADAAETPADNSAAESAPDVNTAPQTSDSVLLLFCLFISAAAFYLIIRGSRKQIN